MTDYNGAGGRPGLAELGQGFVIQHLLGQGVQYRFLIPKVVASGGYGLLNCFNRLGYISRFLDTFQPTANCRVLGNHFGKQLLRPEWRSSAGKSSFSSSAACAFTSVARTAVAVSI
ncbi:MAG: hypothetical protein QF902_08790 [Rhodospirillales bacterium]|nr:hypothetical protein [Rhodospirillales bacterium]